MKNSSSKNNLILVSHSNKQYVHRLIQALLENKYAVVFFSPIWWKKMPGWIKWLPSRFQKKVSGEIKKKFFPFNGSIRIIQKPWLIFSKEIGDKLLPAINNNKSQLNLEKKLDTFVAKQCYKYNTPIVIGYEISSYETFKIAKKQNKITILDLAQVHYKTINSIAQQFAEVAYFTADSDLDEIVARKQAEYDLADYILVLSSFAKQTMIDNNIDEKKLRKVSLGFDVDTFKPKENYNEKGPLKLMICGTDMPRKGFGLLITLLQQMQTDGLDFTLTVVAPAVEIERIASISKGVSFLKQYKFMPHEELVKQYQAADIFVFPSYLDSWAMTVLEAMACGTPVIVSENTGSKDAVKKGGGFVIPTGDAVALRNAIEKFYYDRSLLPAMGKKAREISLQYTWENYYKEIGEIMKEVDLQA